MHFGREFLSKGLWETEQAGHLREACGKVLGSWGMGVSSVSLFSIGWLWLIILLMVLTDLGVGVVAKTLIRTMFV